MALLHPMPQVETYEARAVSLEGIAADVAIDMLRAVQDYGATVGRAESLAADYPEVVVAATAAVMRHAVIKSMPAVASYADEASLSKFHQSCTGDTARFRLPNRKQEEEQDKEEREEAGFAKAMPELAEVTADQLSFIVHCVQRAQAASVNEADHRQASRTLDWLLSRESSRNLESATANSQTRKVRFAGQAVMQWAKGLAASW